MKGKIMLIGASVIGAVYALVSFIKTHPFIDLVAYAFIIISLIAMTVFAVRVKLEVSNG